MIIICNTQLLADSQELAERQFRQVLRQKTLQAFLMSKDYHPVAYSGLIEVVQNEAKQDGYKSSDRILGVRLGDGENENYSRFTRRH